MADKNKKGLHVKNGDRVIVLSGKETVEGANMVTKAQKPQPMAGIQGGLIKLEAPMDASNVMVVCPACEKPTRIKHEVVNGKKVRVCKKCGEQLDA